MEGVAEESSFSKIYATAKKNFADAIQNRTAVIEGLNARQGLRGEYAMLKNIHFVDHSNNACEVIALIMLAIFFCRQTKHENR